MKRAELAEVLWRRHIRAATMLKNFTMVSQWNCYRTPVAVAKLLPQVNL